MNTSDSSDREQWSRPLRRIARGLQWRSKNAAAWAVALPKALSATIRVQRPVAGLLGPAFQRSSDRIEIDITYACNLGCFNCNRSVHQAPSADHMTVGQVERFIEESVDAGIQWQRIRLLGGEPTLHPRVFEIIDAVLGYRSEHSPDTSLELHTNGFGERVNRVLSRVPDDIDIVNTFKTGHPTGFYPFNLAPRDSAFYRFADFSSGCRVPWDCGIGLTPFGYYPCGIAGGIDRVLGFDIGRKRLPDSDDEMRDQLARFCEWCGNFRRGGYNKFFGTVETEVMSPSWQQAYERYRDEPPRLTRL